MKFCRRGVQNLGVIVTVSNSSDMLNLWRSFTDIPSRSHVVSDLELMNQPSRRLRAA